MNVTNISSVEDLNMIGIALAGKVGKGLASSVHTKIKTFKEEKDIEKRSRNYEEIITELLQEREETIRIAQIYKSELERITISDEDIKHLHNTISGALEIFKVFEMTKVDQNDHTIEEVQSKISSYEAIKNLISIDTIKTMQLLGFNYKAAIGEPLTELCSNAISAIASKKGMTTKSKGNR